MKQAFLSFCSVILIVLLFSCKKDNPVPEPWSPLVLDCEKPDYLKTGDKVALISPSFFLPMTEVEKAAEVLRGWGLEPVIGPNVGKIYGGIYSGTVDERISDIRWAFQDSSIKAVICNTGGYGTIHLIDKLTLSEFKNARKWLVGFSDICTMHGLLTRAGVMSIHGTMNSFISAGGTDVSSTLMRDLLFGNVPRYLVPGHPQNITGTATGTLVGGNLYTFTPNLGTDADATAGKDLILFIEEVDESMFNIDRHIRVMQMNGVFDRCKGIILGEFLNCGVEIEDESGRYVTAEEIIRKMLEPYNIPVLCGFPAGHGDVNLPLVMGAPVTIDVRPNLSTITFGIEGQQREFQTSTESQTTKSLLETRMMLSGKKAFPQNESK